jgi:hypothetical protein
MEVTASDIVAREWSVEKVVTFVRSLGPAECFQSAGDQLLQLGVDDSVFFALSLNELEGVCGHTRVYHRMCEFKHNSTDASASTVAQMLQTMNE